MGTIVDLEGVIKLRAHDLVIIVQERRRVAINGGPNARGANPRALIADILKNRLELESQIFRAAFR